MDCTRYEPEPLKNEHPAVWQEIIEALKGRSDVPASLLADMQRRDDFGRQKYHTPLQPFNGRNPIMDAYQEALDLVAYTKQAVMESTKNYQNSLFLSKDPRLTLVHLAAVQCAIHLRQILDTQP
jgi:hypothetical protein